MFVCLYFLFVCYPIQSNPIIFVNKISRKIAKINRSCGENYPVMDRLGSEVRVSVSFRNGWASWLALGLVTGISRHVAKLGCTGPPCG